MKQPLIKLTFFFILGILAERWFHFSFEILLFLAAVNLLFLVFATIRAKKLWLQDFLYGSLALTMFLVLGIIAAELNAPENQPNHYLKNLPASSEALVKLKITEELKPDLYNEKFIAEVEGLNKIKTRGKTIIYIPKDTFPKNLSVDDQILAYAEFNELKPALNPHQFDYKQFLSNRGVFREVRLQEQQIFQIEKEENSLRGIAAGIRSRIISELKNNGFKDDELAIVQALLLGDKREVSREIYEAYANAGAIHILAVSGLHVGILLMLLNFLLKPLQDFQNGKILKLVIVVLLLWGFAFLAGLSPSVVRAVTMFSFIAIGLQLKRKGNIVNTVFASLLILLLINPSFLFEIGFQLSYAAVISIVLFQPLISDLWKPQTKVMKYFWSILTVTFAAQLGVLPLSLFYFHQFPGLFFITNLVLIPILGFILGFGILVIVLALLKWLPDFIATSFEFLIYYLNKFVSLIAQQEDFLFRDISFSAVNTLFLYFIIFSIYLLLKDFSIRKVRMLLVSVILLQLIFIYEKVENTSEVVVFHKSRQTIIGLRKTSNLLLLSHTEIDQKEPFLRDYKVGEAVKTHNTAELKNFFIFENEKYLIVDSLGAYQLQNQNVDFVILKDSPRVHLEKLLEETNPAWIIADGSNYPSFVKLWKETCEKKKVPFHHTGEKGAFTVEY